MKKLIRAALAALMATAGAVVLAPSAAANVDIYITPGYHEVNGREWFTTCEPYSVTHRCTTRIWATQISYVNGRFVQKDDWYFNNLTYRPSPRSIWEKNPLAAYGKVGPTEHKWRAADGREWRTECDTPVTGRGGCRNWVKADVISRSTSGYTWLRQQWVLNSMVRFGPVQPLPDPVGLDPDFTGDEFVPIDPADVPASIGNMKAYPEAGIIYYLAAPASGAGVGVAALGDLGIPLEYWEYELTDATWPDPQVVCGGLPDSSDYGCLFTTPKYGTVLTMPVDVPPADAHLVATYLVIRMP